MSTATEETLTRPPLQPSLEPPVAEPERLGKPASWTSSALQPSQPHLAKGIIAGAAGGLVATVAMTLFQNVMTKLSQPLTRTNESREREQEQGDEDPATVQAANAISQAARGREIEEDHEALAGQVMHYSFGTSMGVLYGIAAEYSPAATTGEGTAFGTLLMIGADEIAVPLAGFSDPPQQTPLSTHLYALGAHLVYGLACEQVRKHVRQALG